MIEIFIFQKSRVIEEHLDLALNFTTRIRDGFKDNLKISCAMKKSEKSVCIKLLRLGSHFWEPEEKVEFFAVFSP